MAAIVLLLSVWRPLPVNAGTVPMDAACAGFGAPGWPGEQGVPLCRKAFAARFDTAAKVPLWTVEHLTKPQVRSTGKGSKRDHFREDPALGKRSPTLADYRGADFDRGHMAPAEDADWDGAAYRETFLLSNVAPMVGRTMNRTLWADIEQVARDWAYCRGEVYVWTGPVLKHPVASGRFIGPSRVAVPEQFYKIIYAPQGPQVIAFLAANQKYQKPAVSSFVVAVDKIEALTGLDFLSALPDAVEQRLEASAAEATRRIHAYQGDGPYCGFSR